MGACCCSLSKVESERGPLYAHDSVSSAQHSSPASAGVYVDTNLVVSTPDTFPATPAQLPFEVVVAAAQNASFENLDSCDLDKKIFKNKSDSDEEPLKQNIDNQAGNILPSDIFVEEDVCPICLEGYDVENPSILTKCEHNYHLACILEWLERSETCPVCDQIAMIVEASQ